MIRLPDACSASIMRSALAIASSRHLCQSSGYFPGAKEPAKGFSTTTCFPAWSVSTAISSWKRFGMQVSTRSTSGSLSSSSKLPYGLVESVLLCELGNCLWAPAVNSDEAHVNAMHT